MVIPEPEHQQPDDRHGECGQQGAVWSVLDQLGTQNMMRSTLGARRGCAISKTVKKRVICSRYIMDFNDGVNFNLDVVTFNGFRRRHCRR